MTQQTIDPQWIGSRTSIIDTKLYATRRVQTCLECSPFAKTHFETWFSILWLILARYELVHYSVFTMYILYIGICRERERENQFASV